MRQLIVLLQIFYFYSTALAADAPVFNKSKSILFILNTEIKTIEQMIVRNKEPRLKHRLVELYSEKAEKSREEENKKFFDAIKTNSILNKEDFYHDSVEAAQKAHSLGLELVKLVSYRRLGEVYLTLAYNSRDYLKDISPEPYYLKALELFSNDVDKRDIVKGSLADYYYNSKNYDKAIKLYTELTSDENNSLWHKYSYNYAWCLLKKEKRQEALKLILKVFAKTKEKKQVELITLLKQQMPVFFYQARAFDEALDFYRLEYDDFPSPAFKLGQTIYRKGEFREGERYLQRVLSLDLEEKKKIEGYLILIDLYKQTHDYTKLNTYLDKLIALSKLKIFEQFTDDQKNELLLAVVDIKNEILRRDDLVRKLELATYISSIYDALSYFEPLKVSEYSFYTGEIFYSINKKEKSKNYYEKCLKNTIEEKFLNLCMEAIFSLDKEGLYKKQDLELEVLLLTYIKSNQAKYMSLSFRRLFSIYRELRLLDKKQDLYFDYFARFKQDQVILQEMSKELIQDAIEEKKIERLEFLASKVVAQEIVLTSELKNNFWKFLGNYYLELIALDVEKSIALADRVLKLPFVPEDIKFKASFNMALGFHHKKDGESALSWLTSTLNHSEYLSSHGEEYLKFLDEFYNLYGDEKFTILANKLLVSSCKIDKLYPRIYQNVYRYFQLNEDLKNLTELGEHSKNCVRDSKQTDVAISKKLSPNQFSQISIDEINLLKQYQSHYDSLESQINLPIPFDENDFTIKLTSTIEHLNALKNLLINSKAYPQLVKYQSTFITKSYDDVIVAYSNYKPKIQDANLAWSIRTTLKTVRKQLDKDKLALVKNSKSNLNLDIAYTLFPDFIIKFNPSEFVTFETKAKEAQGNIKHAFQSIEEGKYEKAAYFFKQDGTKLANEYLVKIYLKMNYLDTALKNISQASAEDQEILHFFNSDLNQLKNPAHPLIKLLILAYHQNLNQAWQEIQKLDYKQRLYLPVALYLAIKVKDFGFYQQHRNLLSEASLKDQLEALFLKEGGYHAKN